MKPTTKIIKETDYFRPYDFKVTKAKRSKMVVESNVPWSDLTGEELSAQWSTITNYLWNEEKEGRIDRKDLEIPFFAYLTGLGIKKEFIEYLRKLKESELTTNLIVIGFLLQNGAKKADSRKFLLDKIRALIGKMPIEEKKEDTPVIPRKTIQENMVEQKSKFLGELQGLEDELKTDIFGWLKANNVPKVFISSFEEFYKPRLDELKLLQKGTDNDLNEAYGGYKKKEIKTMVTWYENLISDFDAYKRLKQSTRKIRISKPKSPTKIVSKLKYLAYDETYKLTSIKPETIIGATSLYLFNVKTRKLIVYNASDSDKELTVKGTYILGWDPKNSIGKTLRKPQEQLKTFISGGKVSMRKFIPDIRGVAAKLNGKIGKDMLLLKVF